MWQVRKLYGGGTPLPPTDPRILALTPEQIELDLAHLALDDPALDKPTGEGKAAFDPEYGEYERQVEEEARQMALEQGIQPLQDPAYEQYEQEVEEENWVDAEID